MGGRGVVREGEETWKTLQADHLALNAYPVVILTRRMNG